MFLKIIEDPCISVFTLEIKAEKFLKYRIYTYKDSREVTSSHVMEPLKNPTML